MALTAENRSRLAANLVGYSWLESCGSEALDQLLRNAVIDRYEKAQLVELPGAGVDHLSILLEGSLEICLNTARGRKFVIGYLPPGQPFGLVPLFDGKAAATQTRAHVPSKVLKIPKQDLLAAMQMDQAMLHSIMRVLAQRSRRVHLSLAEMLTLPLSTRLARLLLSLSADYGVEQGCKGRAIALRIAQDDLAAMVGVTRQRLNIELNSMERNGVVKLAYARVVVLDEKALQVQALEPAQ